MNRKRLGLKGTGKFRLEETESFHRWMDVFGVKKACEFPVSALKSKEERDWKREGSKTCTVLPACFF